MSINIHWNIEKRDAAGEPWREVLGRRGRLYAETYQVFAFLAGVRNQCGCEPISEPRGLPADVSPSVRRDAEQWADDVYAHSWLSLRELLDFDYGRSYVNQREDDDEHPHGEPVTYREHLGEGFFQTLTELQEWGAPEDVRVVFWFG